MSTAGLAILAVSGGDGVDLGRVGLALCYILAFGGFLEDMVECLECGEDAMRRAAGVLEVRTYIQTRMHACMYVCMYVVQRGRYEAGWGRL
jgi:hypothetical protein